MAGEVPQQILDARQVTLAHLFDDEGVGCVQHHRVEALLGLQGLQPGVYILGRQFGFQAFEAAGPGIHRGQQSSSSGRHARSSRSGAGRG